MLSLALFASVVPALIVSPTLHAGTSVTTRSRPIRALGLSPNPGFLPEMYRARWRGNEVDQDERMTEDSDALNVKHLFATALGATVGVCSISTLGAFKSISLTDWSLTMIGNTWGYGNVHDISPFLLTITDWCARANAMFTMPSIADCVFALVVTIDFAAFGAAIAISMQMIEEERAEQDMAVADSSTELCVVTSLAGSVCGSASFDSSPDFACVEQIVDGKLRWVCA